MEQRRGRCEGAKNGLVDPMHRAYPRNHRDRLQDLASPRPNPRHRCHAAAPPVVAAPFAGVSSPSCSACSLCLSYASSLRGVAGSGSDGVAIDSGHDGVEIGLGHDDVAVGWGSGGIAVACVNSHELNRKLHHVAADSGGAVAVVCAGCVLELKRRLQPVAVEHGDVAAAVATAEAEAVCAGFAPELERKLALVAVGIPLT